MGLIIESTVMPSQRIEMLAEKESPSFREWRVGGPGQNDATMIPDRGFVKQLHAFDDELWPLWDWGATKWEIWRFPKNGKAEFHIMTVQTQGRTYRELGADIIINLAKGDPARYSHNDFIRYFSEMDGQVQRRKRKELKDKLHDMAWDSFINLHCKIIQVPKEFKARRAISDGE